VSASRPPVALLGTLLGLAFLCNTIGRGVTETFAVFLLPIERDLGVTRAEITATYSIYMLVHGIAAPFAGQIIDRLGARFTYAIGLLLLGGGYVLGAQAGSMPIYYLTVGAMSGLGAACLGMVVASSLLSRWFTHGIGSVMAVPYAAVGFGVLIVPPFTQWLLESQGWREAHATLGYTILAVLPLLFVLPLGRITRGSEDWRKRRQQSVAAGDLWTVSRAIRTPAFWALFSVYFWTAVAAYAVLPQSVAFLVERGFDPLVAAGAFGFTGLLSTVGIIAMGWISDRIGRFPSVVGSYVMSMTGTACLLAVAWYPEWILVYGFVLFFGLMQGARGPVIAALVAILYRGGSVGAIFGTLSLALGLGASIGSYLSGLLHDMTGDYVASFALAIGGSLIGLLSYTLSSSLRRETHQSAPA
jgi:MFS family permease